MKNIVVLSLLLVCTLALGGCSLSSRFYQNAKLYMSGDAEIAANVSKLDINWTQGSVNVLYHAETTISLAETSDKQLSAEQQMRWYVEGDTLYVQYQGISE